MAELLLAAFQLGSQQESGAKNRAEIFDLVRKRTHLKLWVVLVLRKISSIKKKLSAFHQDNSNGVLRVSQDLARPHHSRHKGMKEQIHFKDLSWRRKCLWGTLLTKDCVEQCLSRTGFTVSSYLGIQRLQQPCPKRPGFLSLQQTLAPAEWCWFCKGTEHKSYRITEVSTLILKEGPGWCVKL